MPCLVTLTNVTVGYDKHPAVHHLSGCLGQGEWLAVMGPNGGGKSTLLKALAGLIPNHEGTIERHNLNEKCIAYLPQTLEIHRQFPITVEELVLSGAVPQKGLWSSLKKNRHDMVAALKAVNLLGFEKRPIGTLSGGQLQRALFARVMMQNAQLILLDEPLAAVDQHTREDLMTLMKQWPQEGRTVVIVLHDEALVKKYIPQTLLLARDKIAWGKTQDVLTLENLKKAQSLHEAFPENTSICAVETNTTPHLSHNHHD